MQWGLRLCMRTDGRMDLTKLALFATVRTQLKLLHQCCILHTQYINSIIHWFCYRKTKARLTRRLYHYFAHMLSDHNPSTYVDGCYPRTSVTSSVTSIECVELYPVKLGLSDYCGIERRRGRDAGADRERQKISQWMWQKDAATGHWRKLFCFFCHRCV